MTWLAQIEAELDKIEPADDEVPILTTPDSPQYLRNAERQIGKAMAPSIKFKRGDTLNAASLGALLGHKIAYVKPFAEGLRISKQFDPKLPAEIKDQFKQV